MRPGTFLSLADDHWLEPLRDDAPVPEEHLVVLVEGYAAFPDGEVVRLPMHAGDELEPFEGLLTVPEQILAGRPAIAGAERDEWARAIWREFIQPHLRPSSAELLATLTQYSKGEIASTEAKASLGVDRRGLIALLARHGLPLPHIDRSRAEQMAREALEAIGIEEQRRS
jgi:hypothetical protein